MAHLIVDTLAGRTIAALALLGAALWMQPATPVIAAQDSQEPVAAQQAPAEPVAQTPEPAPAAAEPAEDQSADPAAAGDIPLSDAGVEAIQNSLKQLGYFSGPADTRKGPRLRTAVRNFQRDQALPVTGSLDQPTVERIQQQVELVHVEAAATTAPETATAPVESAPTPSKSSGGATKPLKAVGGVFAETGKAVGTAGSATVHATKTAGSATVDATKTAGSAVGDAGAVTARSTAKAGTVVGESAMYAGTTVAKGTMAIYDTTRRAFVGDKRTDEDIRAGIERQFASESRIVPGEIDVKVVKGNVTLTLPDGAQSDLASATRLAKLTPGVKTVTTVYVSVDTFAPPQPREDTIIPVPPIPQSGEAEPVPASVPVPVRPDSEEPASPPVQP